MWQAILTFYNCLHIYQHYLNFLLLILLLNSIINNIINIY